MAAAAVFDLDRTLVRGVTGPALARALRQRGLAGREIPGERWMFGLVEAFGENLPAMVLARQAVTLARGRQAAEFRAAGADAVPELLAMVPAAVTAEIASHREAGRRVVVATTSPRDLVAAFAEALGLDDVIATRYGVDASGCYDGTLEGPFVWSAGKLTAVRSWCDANGIDLRDCWAYSDSIFDAPLLSAVGHPCVVNPDARLQALALTRGWPRRDLDGRDGVAKVPGTTLEAQEALLGLTHPAVFPYVRFDLVDLDLLPERGPAIVCANHRSYFDVAAMAVAFARRGRPVRFLGKKEVFDAPVIGTLARALGGIRVERGTGSDEPLAEAQAALDAGDIVAIMPQGTIPRGRAFFDPVLRGRWGAARLAAATGAPVYPVGLWGTEQVWPRNSRIPHVWNLTNPPTVRIRAGDPLELRGPDPDVDTHRLMDAIMALLPPEAGETREPTAEELARTMPPGAPRDPMDQGHERQRRPGTD